ncbi:uncharacterized protein LOC127265883 [Andrographis paniculata]|uniref:uncharacterized protein LOC127265883 n=1 Tax=Andrographis paniculata TaxID=175694 RepID=UPI0021E6E3E9|nr:uncharacterized protein LOC127265883 [Andrographis paniculata]
MEDPRPGRVRSQRKVDGQLKTDFHYFRWDIFLEVVDHITQEMDNHFTETSSELLLGIPCLDPRDSFANFDDDKLLRLAKLYPYDFDDFDDEVMLAAELKQYISIVKKLSLYFFLILRVLKMFLKG